MEIIGLSILNNLTLVWIFAKLLLFTGEFFSFDRRLKLRFGLAGFREIQRYVSEMIRL